MEKTTLATQALLDGEAEILTRKVVELAKEGHRVSASLPEEAVVPSKDQPWPSSSTFQGAENMPQILAAIIQAVPSRQATLPLHPSLSLDDLDQVVEAVTAFVASTAT